MQRPPVRGWCNSPAVVCGWSSSPEKDEAMQLHNEHMKPQHVFFATSGISVCQDSMLNELGHEDMSSVPMLHIFEAAWVHRTNLIM